MRSATLEVLLLWGIVLLAPVSLGLLAPDDLEWVLAGLAAWALGSTLLVGAAGAWVAWGRSRRTRRVSQPG